MVVGSEHINGSGEAESLGTTKIVNREMSFNNSKLAPISINFVRLGLIFLNTI